VFQFTRRSLWQLFCAGIVLTALMPAPARADGDPDFAAAKTSGTTAGTAGAAGGIDAGDLWRRLRRHAVSGDGAGAVETKKPFFVVAPTIGSKPSTGLTAGLSSNIAFVAGDTGTTHISSISGGLRVSQQGQTLSGIKLAVFTPGDRWFIQGDNRLSWTSQNTYGLGADASAADAENLKYSQFRLYETAYRAVAPGLFVGAGINVNRRANIRPGSGAAATFDQAEYVTYSERHGFDLERETSAGTSVALQFDTRDNAINPGRGWLANTTYRTFFDGFLGGDSSWQEASFDVRTYRSLARDGRRKLAFWLLGDFVTSGTAPYFDLPTIAGDSYGRSARGYSEGRYRGERLMYGEVEYRDTLTRNGLVGFVTFLNTTTIDGQTAGERLFDSFAPGAGFGLRFLLNKKSRTNLCADYGWGKQGSRGLYLAIQEAF
jgi:hypothetical protein